MQGARLTLLECLLPANGALKNRRIRLEMTYVVSNFLVAEIEARHTSDTLTKNTLGRVLAEAKRVATQYVAAEQSAIERAAAAATEVSVSSMTYRAETL